MKTLHEAINAHAKGAAPGLTKWLNECGLRDWEDLTRANLNELRDLMLENMAQSTARTYFAVLKAILKRYEDEAPVCKDYANILKAKNEKPVKTFLDRGDLEKLERVEIRTANEQYVLDVFLIGAYTGMRVSDAMEVSEENMANGFITYISIKTGIQAVIPMREGMDERIRRVQANDCDMPVMTFNRIIRKLCERAGLTERVKVFKAGEHMKGEKWRHVSSHTARISFATNLSILGVPLIQISRCMGHTSTGMTERYIIPTRVQFSPTALKYFQK